MPCYSASNVRFISAKDQLEYRAKTAPRVSHKSTQGLLTAGLNWPPCPTGSQQRHRRGSSGLSRLRSVGEFPCYVPSSQPKPDKTQLRNALRSKPATLNHKELERLQSAAKVTSIEERLEALVRREELAKQLEEQAERARLHFRKIDEERLEAAVKNAHKGAEEENLFGTADKQKTLERAFIVKHEQEEEVKAVNRIILNAKCHAVRDAQVQEKHDIEKEQQNEKRRLEKKVIEESIRALAEEDCHAERKKIRNAKYAEEIRQQLEYRQYMRFIEAERAEEEARVQREAAAAIKRDEEREALEARERRQKFREELNRVVEMSNLFKKMLCEQERESDMRIAAYMREKRDREKELEREKKLAQEEFERQRGHLYDLAQKIYDSKAHRDELSYIREQERVERAYRRREKEMALRKKQLEKEIKEARERQLNETKARQALQLAREEKDFNILIENLKKEEERLQKREDERQKQLNQYRSEILRQIGDKALAKRRMLEDARTEANIWSESENRRRANIRAVITAKLAAMREACLPERYIRDVERQLNRFIHAIPKRQSENQQ